MVDVSGIPNMGFGGGGYFGGSAALGQPAMSAAQINAGIWGNYSPGAAQATQNNIYGAGGFGAQPAYYAGLGAAYGRQTGGFGGYGAPNADPFTAVPYSGGGYPGGAVQRGPDLPAPDTGGYNPLNPYGATAANPYGQSVFERGAAAFNPYGGGANPGGFSPSPNYTGGQASAYNPFPQYAAGGYNPFAAASYAPAAQRGIGGGGYGSAAYEAASAAAAAAQANPYAGMILGPMGNPTAYNPGSYAGDQSNYGIPYNRQPMAGDIGFSRQSPMPNLGYNPGMQNWFANPGMGGGAFQGRFGMGFPNAGTPSQVMPEYGNSLTTEDRYLAPHWNLQQGGGGA